MKISHLLLTAFLLATWSSQSQTLSPGYTKIDVQLKHWLAQPQLLAKEQPALFKNGPVNNPMIPVIFKSTVNGSQLIERYQGVVHSKIGNIYTALIPLNGLLAFAGEPAVIKIESSQNVRITNENVKKQIGADRVHAGMLPGGASFTGKGVIVGVLDSGIDFMHRDFRKKSNSTQTRILSIWDQTLDGGMAPQNYNYGSEWGTDVASSLSRSAPQSGGSGYGYMKTDEETILFDGISMASPVTSGAIALYLEKHPTADFDEVKTALITNAINDDLTTMYGAIPNNHFGYGRLDIYKAMGGLFHTGVQTRHNLQGQNMLVYPNPANEFVTFNTGPKTGLAEVSVFDLNGRLITRINQQDINTKPGVDVQHWKKGLYFFRVTAAQGTTTGKFIVE